MTDTAYVGRFAPSPTGPLHFGSLLAATASYLEAKQRGGRWLLRIDDIDPPREQPGATEAILGALEAYGFAWDGDVYYQSRQVERHRSLVRQLVASGRAYRCGCSRQDLAEAPRGPLGIIYPGTCRNGSGGREGAIRLRTDGLPPIRFDDVLQGPQHQDLERESGDFVILRRDGLIAYHLAVVADDHDQQVTHIVRGADLLDSTPRQVFLQRLLGYPTPEYAHIPVAENAAGQKLSKMTGATSLPLDDVRPTLVDALRALRQEPPQGLASAPLADIWSWALERWNMAVLRNRRRIDSVQDGLRSGPAGGE